MSAAGALALMGGLAELGLSLSVYAGLFLSPFFLALFLPVLARWRTKRLRARTQGFEERSEVRAFGAATHVRGHVDGVPCLATPHLIDVRLDTPPALAGDYTWRALRELAAGRGVSPILARPGSVASLAALLQAARFRRLEIREGRVRVVGLIGKGVEGQDFAGVVRAVVSVVRPPSLARIQPSAAASVCPYCKDSRHRVGAEAILRCPTCEVVHHAECWRENGGCSIHGCDAGPAGREERRAALERDRVGRT